MKKLLLSFLTVISAFSSNAQSSPFEMLENKVPLGNILGFLASKELGEACPVNKEFNAYGKTHSKWGQILRKNSRFHVTIPRSENQGSHVLFLEEYLFGERRAITGVSHLMTILQERPDDYVKLILKSINLLRENT